MEIDISLVKVDAEKLKKGKTARLLKYTLSDLYNSVNLLDMVMLDENDILE